MSYNKIKHILLDKFDNDSFPELKYLDLKNNPFTSIEYIEPLMFNQLTELWVDIDNEHDLSREIEPNDTVKVFYYSL